MIFGDIIKGVVEGVAGFGGVIMDKDGIALETYTRGKPQLDIQTIGVEFAGILNTIRKTSEVMRSGNLQEIAVNTENSSIIVRSLNEDYFFALAIAPEGNFGKARYLMRLAAPKIIEQL